MSKTQTAILFVLLAIFVGVFIHALDPPNRYLVCATAGMALAVFAVLVLKGRNV